jgi:hypothetical protein
MYILTPVPEELLHSVDMLLVGRGAAEVPTSLLHAGELGVAAPHVSVFALGGAGGAAVGAKSGKSRRNLGRSRLGGGTQ